MASDGRIVYTTGIGRVPICKHCGAPATACTCRSQQLAASLPQDGYVRLSRDRKSRGGKTVTLISGLSDVGGDLSTVATALKRLCGSGGSVKDGVVLIQGDHRDKVESYLKGHGFKVKRVGG